MLSFMSANFVLPQPFQPMGIGQEEAEGNVLLLRESSEVCILHLSLSPGLECNHMTKPDIKGSWSAWLDYHIPNSKLEESCINHKERMDVGR